MDYPGIEFRWSQPRFAFQMRKKQKVVFLGPPQHNFGLLALHELGHALCGHETYQTHVKLIKIESEAWEMAKTVYLKYRKMAENDAKLANIIPEWDEDFMQEKIDSYREWLHQKSLCKKCGITMYQTKDGNYHCPRCESFL